MRIFMTPRFARFARAEDISHSLLVEAVARAERGQVGALAARGHLEEVVIDDPGVSQ